MKYVIAIFAIATTLAISDCSTTDEKPLATDATEIPQLISSTLQPSQSPVATQIAVPTRNAEEILKDYLNALINKDYKAFRELAYPDNLNMSIDKFISTLKENDLKNGIERTEYMVSHITNYDENNKLAKVIIKGKTSSGEASSEDLLGLKLLDGTWKVDLSLITSKEEIKTIVESKYLQVKRVEKISKLNGYQFNIYYTN